MANSFFSFQQFTIHQDRCAMKVCTDACLFGAWIAESMTSEGSIETVLDIGAGTGLLCLMLAQKIEGVFDAIELDSAAATQAGENFLQSPWKQRLNIYEGDVEHVLPGKKYDLIISNPPFFEDDLKSVDQQRNAAMHGTTLTLEILLHHIQRLLSSNGHAAVLIPYHRHTYFEALLQRFGFHVQQVMHVKHSVKHSFFRSQYIFSLQKGGTIRTEISIRSAQNEYSREFVDLLKDYYLKL